MTETVIWLVVWLVGGSIVSWLWSFLWAIPATVFMEDRDRGVLGLLCLLVAYLGAGFIAVYSIIQVILMAINIIQLIVASA